jgi:heme exporter protein D
MIWNSASEFFAMGGYGLYVWGAYAVTLVCLLVEPVLAALRLREARRALSVEAGS